MEVMSHSSVGPRYRWLLLPSVLQAIGGGNEPVMPQRGHARGWNWKENSPVDKRRESRAHLLTDRGLRGDAQ